MGNSPSAFCMRTCGTGSLVAAASWGQQRVEMIEADLLLGAAAAIHTDTLKALPETGTSK